MSHNPTIKELENGIYRCLSCGIKLEMTGDGFNSTLTPCPKCSSPLFHPFQVGVYWCVRPLGGGGMGSVYYALSASDKCEYAVKVVPKWLAGKASLVDNLRKEAKTGMAIGSHKNLITIADYGDTDGGQFMAMELVKGDRLDSIITSQGGLTELRAWEIVAQLVEAEEHICSKGYLFRDMKPENILVEADGNVRLFDYGLCTTIAKASEGATTNEVVGSPFYLPPERVIGSAEGEHSEIYSLGMVLYHMLSGTTYYSNSEIGQLMVKHLTFPRFTSVGTRLKGCSPETVAILDKMLARFPAQRYFDFHSLKTAMTPLLSKLRLAAKLGKSGKPLKPAEANSMRRAHPLARLSTALLALVFLIAAVLSLIAFNHFLENQAAAKARAESRKKIAARLGIPPDVKPPSLTTQQIELAVAKAVDEALARLTTESPAFDEASARKEIMAKWGVEFISQRAPTMPADEARKSLEAEISRLVDNEPSAQISPFSPETAEDRLRKEFRIPVNAGRPLRTLEELKADIATKLEQAADDKFNPAELTDSIRGMMRRLELAKKGDNLSVLLKSGAQVSGVFNGFKGTSIVIDKRTIKMAELMPDDAARFNQQLSSTRIAEETRRLKDEYKRDKEKFKQDKAERIAEQLYAKAGYFKLSSEKWVGADDLLAAKIGEARQKWEADAKERRKAARTEVESKFDKAAFLARLGYKMLEDGALLPEKEAFETAIASLAQKREAGMDVKKKEIARIAREKAELDLYPASGYIKHNGKWASAKDVLDQLER